VPGLALAGARRLARRRLESWSDVAPQLGERAIGAALAGIGSRDGVSVMLLDVDHLMRRVREERA